MSNALKKLKQTTFSLEGKKHVESIIIESIGSGDGGGNDDQSHGKNRNPAIMIPHGGPHNVSVNSFNAVLAALALENCM